ncbi:ATG8/AUT7/APG8/PAZ2, putative [Leishmania tarentolae]|uniref:ATG8/AUT7/APG8/PAZ2, putative n=1 Tax=Leishmania tarentolae TaxID=5689 RepID=A0A640KE48_LEITA|nr:ATG8/AUT7/APG8/PAZ2, putative [Leishmania tarentolae]GET87974.1 ATG8/AUT7/APG8/PAZ2, putative [Leishmania tarentolae]GET87977.1 ATG8/AUT7/APG8/PAZ2, putative [Leishmania tarentolae]GET87978.1 ATG8/AUT7/APG8/PAZ2, putative [Leishmania tarentolae]GET93968.1 ATG8/AUT7/APG8/PAZ2, putative [Leishmania tarentolae]
MRCSLRTLTYRKPSPRLQASARSPTVEVVAGVQPSMVSVTFLALVPSAWRTASSIPATVASRGSARRCALLPAFSAASTTRATWPGYLACRRAHSARRASTGWLLW